MFLEALIFDTSAAATAPIGLGGLIQNVLKTANGKNIAFGKGL